LVEKLSLFLFFIFIFINKKTRLGAATSLGRKDEGEDEEDNIQSEGLVGLIPLFLLAYKNQRNTFGFYNACE